MAPPRSRGQPRGENRAPARNGAATLDVAALPAKHRAVRNFIKAVPPDQREDALIQAVLVGINTINSNTGKGAAGARPAEPEEREDAPDSGPGEADKTQWIHPADIETQSDTINGSEAGDTALTVDELDPPADNRQGALDPRIYPDWWGWDDGEPAEQQKAPAKKTSSVSTNSGYVENRAVRMQTRPTAPIRNGARAQGWHWRLLL